MSTDSTLNQLQTEVAKILNREAVPEDLGLAELGLDSLKVVELILVCDKIYPGNIDPEQLRIDQFTTLEDLDRQLREASSVEVQ